MNLALAVTMLDELHSMFVTLHKVGDEFASIDIVQSGEAPFHGLQDEVDRHETWTYTKFPDLDTRTEAEKQGPGERYDIGARAQSRNYSHAFGLIWRRVNHYRLRVDYAIGIHGDTVIQHLDGVRQIIADMGNADIAVSRAMGQRFHRASLSREQMADPNHPKEGRLQDDSVKDFMPQFFIARTNLLEQLSQIEVTNRWCMEQCIGDAIGEAKQYVFSQTAYGFNNGIIYHWPSPKGWKH